MDDRKDKSTLESGLTSPAAHDEDAAAEDTGYDAPTDKEHQDKSTNTPPQPGAS